MKNLLISNSIFVQRKESRISFNHSKCFLSNQIKSFVYGNSPLAVCNHEPPGMYQIAVKKFTKNLFNLSTKRFFCNNSLIDAAAKGVDADSYHLDVCRSMNDHIMHRFTISHSYLTIGNYFNEGKRFDGFTGLNLSEKNNRKWF